MFRWRWNSCAHRATPLKWVSYQSQSHRYRVNVCRQFYVEPRIALLSRFRSHCNRSISACQCHVQQGQVSLLTDTQSLPPPPLPASILYLPSIPTYLIPPCLIPWPFRSLCPSRLLGYDTSSRLRDRRNRAGFSSPARGKDVVLLRKQLMEGVIMKPGRSGESQVGAVFVSIGKFTSMTYGLFNSSSQSVGS